MQNFEKKKKTRLSEGNTEIKGRGRKTWYV